jgi:outer membrane biogenesis lipoprotein LolB
MPRTIRPPLPTGAAAARTTVLAVAMAMLAACRPEPPPPEQPPEPQARAHTELRDAIQAPQDKARALEKTLQDDAARQRAQIDDAEGG